MDFLFESLQMCVPESVRERVYLCVHTHPHPMHVRSITHGHECIAVEMHAEIVKPRGMESGAVLARHNILARHYVFVVQQSVKSSQKSANLGGK